MVRRGNDNQADFERLKAREAGPPPKHKMPQFQAGLGAMLAGADDPRGNAPGFAAMMFAIFCGLTTAITIIIQTQAQYWYIADTGAHVGLEYMTVKNWYCGDTEACGYITTAHESGSDWQMGGLCMFATSVITVLMLLASICLHCVNLGEDGTRQNAVFACGLMDAAIVVLLGGLLGYYYITKKVRADKTPDKNGVVENWTLGANFLGTGLCCFFILVGAVASMAAKPEVEDEGMQAAMQLTTAAPETTKVVIKQPPSRPDFAKRYGA